MVYDQALRLGERRGMEARRRDLLARARGRVLEIGAGTGLNLDHYPNGLEGVTLTEPSRPMADQLRARMAQLGTTTPIIAARAEALPFANHSFDTVVSTLVLCTVADPEAAIAEVRRVLRPGGLFLFSEHVRSASRSRARRQDRWANAWAAIADGCRCNRETLAAIAARFTITHVEHAQWNGMPGIIAPLVTGEAVPETR